jgi:uncharacterized membrane protein
MVAPFALRRARRPSGALVLASAAGVAYALSALFSKQLANLLHDAQAVPFLLALAAAGICAVLGFINELGALQQGEASVVTPLDRALQTIIPIACAPLLFGEHWPADGGARALLASGILLTLLGILVVSHHPEPVRRAPAAALA